MNSAERSVTWSAFALALLALAGCSSAPEQGVPSAGQGLQVRLTLERAEYGLGEPIPATVAYTNSTGKPLTLFASGVGSGSGFSGEVFVVTAGRSRIVYTSRGVDPEVEQHRIEPGQSWRHAIPDLRAALRSCFCDDRRAADRSPFGRPGRYLLRLTYDSDLKAPRGDVFVGRAEAEAVEAVVSSRKTEGRK